MFDFHTHTILSDGELIPSELVRRAFVNGYKGIGLTDHVDFANIDHVLSGLKKAKLLEEDLDIKVIVGVEITHVPPSKIDRLVSKAKNGGAELVVVHGETVVEPVFASTNLSAVKNVDVDILAHPGLITPEEVKFAEENEVFLEITSRKGHNTTNGHVARVAEASKARLLVNTDAHSPDDLITGEFALKVALGAGLPEKDADETINKNPYKLLEKLEMFGL
ncbi:MAG: histidinol phosphate phosphatase domain-containing protein [Halobacteriota archaeon]|nr:histidinol phosphate phosphatase domain-containing protein [Halobacteriota archaeon]